MKKLLSVVAAIAVCTSLASCGNNDDTVSETTTDSETTISESTTVAETALAPQESIAEEITETIAETTNVASETTTAETTEASTEASITTTEAENETASEEEIVIDDSDEEMTVNTSFSDMDEFLAADIFMLDGKKVSADQALSANIFNTLSSDFYLETSDFNGGSPFKLAIKGDMLMTENEEDGVANKLIVRDSRAYTFDHENKVALFLPANKELTSHYTPVGLEIVPENISKESFIIADVTIGGKAYKFEYGATSDWAMLYNSDGTLYASVKSGDSLDCELYKFAVTSKIPSGIFDIPEDYFQLDLEEMMQNAPPPEEME